MVNSTVTDPQSLWDQFRDYFTDSCSHRIPALGNTLNPAPEDWTMDQVRYDFGLWLFGENLRDLGLDWSSVSISGPVHNWQVREVTRNPLLLDALDINIEEERRQFMDAKASFSTG